MNSAIFATTIQKDAAKKSRKKPRFMVFELADGRVERIPWHESRKPTDREIREAMAEAEARAAHAAKVAADYAASPNDRYLPAAGAPSPKPMTKIGQPRPARAPKTWVQNVAESAGKKLVDSGVIKPLPEEQMAWSKPNPEQVLAMANQYARTGGKPWSDKNLVPFIVEVGGQKVTRYLTPEDAEKVNAYAARSVPDPVSRAGVTQIVANANRMSDELLEGVTESKFVTSVGTAEADAIDKILPGYKKAVGAKGVTGHLAGMLSAIATAPIEAIADAAVVVGPGMSLEERARGVFNVLVNSGAVEAAAAVGAGKAMTKIGAKRAAKAAAEAIDATPAPPHRLRKIGEPIGADPVVPEQTKPKGASVLDEVLGPKTSPAETSSGSVLDEALGNTGAAAKPTDAVVAAMRTLGMPEEQIRGVAAAINPILEQNPGTVFDVVDRIDPTGKLRQELERASVQIDVGSLSREVLSKMDRALKAQGYDSRGASDVLQMLKERIARDGVMTHPDWIAAYEKATGSRAARVAKLEAQKSLPNVNWQRIRELGTTADMREAGYIKPDGGLVDLSGKREGAQPGSRSLDHREAGGTAGMQELIAEGYIRMDHNSGSIDISKAPTPEQYRAIARLASDHNGEIVIDLADGLGELRDTYYLNPERTFSREYPAGTRYERIRADIDRFFNGEDPLPLNKFRQEEDGVTKGAYTPEARVIELVNGKADVSTIIHEVAHDWHGFLVDHPTHGATVKRIYGDLGNVEGAERFARDFEKFLASGKSPVKGLQSVFESFRQWMADIYGKVFGGNIPKEARAIFKEAYQNPSEETMRLVREFESVKAKPAEVDPKALQIADPENVGASQVQTDPLKVSETESLSVDPPSTPTSARQADINADREALGKAGFSTDDVRKWSELEAKADPDAVPMDGDEYKVSAWSDQETVNATAKLRDLKAKIEALRKSGDDPETLVTLEDKFDKLTEAMYRSGTEQGRALAARRYTMDVDMSVDGLRARYKARAAKNGTKVDAKRLAELEKIADDYAKLQSQIDSGELVKARKRSSGPAKTKEELSAELSKMWDEFTAPIDPLAADSAVPLANAFTGERLAMIGKMAVKAVELGVATVDELVEAIGKQFAARGLDIPDRETILKAWRTERESGKRGISEEAKAARAQRAKIEYEIKAELDAPKKAEAARQAAEAKAKRAAEAADARAKKAAERQQRIEADRNAKADQKAKARAEREAADAEAKALREEQERILGERKAWDKRNKERERELNRLNARIAELEKSIEAGTGEGPKTRKPSKDDADLARLRARQTMLQSKARAIYASTQPKGIADKAVGLLNVPRTIKASIDISAPGRQGWILGIGNPKAAGRAFADQMRALSTEEGAVMAQNAIMDRPNAPKYKAADLYLAPVDGSLNAKEEAFLGSEMFSRWKKFNPVRASDRAYAAYLNRLRADVFDKMVGALGQDATEAELRDIARYINVASGRGDIGLKGASDAGKSVANAMPALAMGFWSPRNLASRVQFATGVPIAQAIKTPGARRLIAKEYAKSIIATGSVIGLAKLALERSGEGGVSGDISSSDFGKIRAGDTRVDIMAGVQQPLVLIGRLMTGKSTSPVSGKVTDLQNPKFGQSGPKELVSRFGWSKANPIFGSFEEFYTGKDFVGQPVGKGEALVNVIAPLSVKEIYEALTEEGIDKQDALVLLNIFGISTARFKDKEKAQP